MKKKLRHYTCGQCHLKNKKRAMNKGYMSSLLRFTAPIDSDFDSVTTNITCRFGSEQRRDS